MVMAYAHRQFKLNIVHVQYLQHSSCGVHVTYMSMSNVRSTCLGRYINGDEVHTDGTAISSVQVHVSS